MVKQNNSKSSKVSSNKIRDKKIQTQKPKLKGFASEIPPKPPKVKPKK